MQRTIGRFGQHRPGVIGHHHRRRVERLVPLGDAGERGVEELGGIERTLADGVCLLAQPEVLRMAHRGDGARVGSIGSCGNRVTSALSSTA